MEKRATEGVEEADLFKVQTWETGERADRSRHASSGCGGTPSLFEEPVAVGMRVVCPQDVTKMLFLKSQDRLVEEVGKQTRVRS